jgi:polyhydroxyalkanoate synthesis regulator protein
MTSLTKEQEKLRSQMSEAFGATAFEAIEDQVKRNTEMFERAMKMFMPFPSGSGESAASASPAKPAKSGGSDIDDMKRQLEEMQKKINQLSEKS